MNTNPEQIRQYGKQENAFILSFIFNPKAARYDDLAYVEKTAIRAVEQAGSAFGKDDVIYLEALLNLAMFQLIRKRDAVAAGEVLKDAKKVLQHNYTTELEEMLTEFIALSIQVALVANEDNVTPFAPELLFAAVPAPFDVKVREDRFKQAGDIYGLMAKRALSSISPVLPYLVAECGRPLALQLASAGFSLVAQAILRDILPPLVQVVWGKNSSREKLYRKEAGWLEPGDGLSAERSYELARLGRDLAAVAARPVGKIAVPEDLREAWDLFQSAFGLVKQVIKASPEKRQDLVVPGIIAFQEALDALIIVDQPRAYDTRAQWQYQLQAGLGCFSFAYKGSEKAGFTDQAISSLEQALVIVYDQAFVFDKALKDAERDHLISALRLLISFGYSRRTQGNIEENIGSVLAYSDSLEFDRKKEPYYWAMGKLMRGIGFQMEEPKPTVGSNHPDKVPPEVKMSAALSFFEQCMEVFEPEGYPYEWATALLVWCSATRLMMGADAPRDGKEMYYSYLRNAEYVFTPVTHAPNWCRIQLYLADLASFRSGAEDILAETALEVLSNAQAFLSRSTHPKEWGLLELKKARLLLAVDGNLERAGLHYSQSLDIFEERDDQRYAILSELGDVAFSDGLFERAIVCLEEAFAMGNDRYERSQTVFARRFSVRLLEGVSAKLAFAYYKQGLYKEALLAFERGKSMLLYENLSILHADLGALKPADQITARKLMAGIRQLEAEEYGGMTYTEHNEQLRFDRLALKKMLPGYYEELDVHDPLTVITRHIPAGTLLLIPLVSKHGGMVFCLSGGSEVLRGRDIIDLPELTSAEVHSWLFDDPNSWFPAYHNRNEILSGSAVFDEAIDLLCERSSRKLFQPIFERVAELNVSRIAFIPSGGLQFLPLAAVGRQGSGGKAYLIDRNDFMIVPSVRILGLLKNDHTPIDVNKAAVVGVGTYKKLADLPNAVLEAKKIAARFGVPPLIDRQVTPEALQQNLSGANLVHLACHGANWAEDPGFESSIVAKPVLHFGETEVTFRDILQGWNLSAARLVTLSACDTGLVDFSKPWDEFEGLSHILLQTGSNAVLGTLWSVDDESTSLLMIHFYELLLRSGNDPVSALCQAQRWLRDATHDELVASYGDIYTSNRRRNTAVNFKPFEQPFYWAPFFITGI